MMTATTHLLHAQIHMRIHHKSGGYSDFKIERIDSLTFVDGSDLPDEASSLIGSWLWGNVETGYYESLTFNKDKTYTCYDNYFTYGFDTMTYGWYAQSGSMLTMQSNGFGYRRLHRWFVTALTENALEVMTKMGIFTYYRIQSEVYTLRIGEEAYACVDEDYYVFTDGVKVADIEGKLKGINEGTTYILKYNAASGFVMAYKVVVKK